MRADPQGARHSRPVARRRGRPSRGSTGARRRRRPRHREPETAVRRSTLARQVHPYAAGPGGGQDERPHEADVGELDRCGAVAVGRGAGVDGQLQIAGGREDGRTEDAVVHPRCAGLHVLPVDTLRRRSRLGGCLPWWSRRCGRRAVGVLGCHPVPVPAEGVLRGGGGTAVARAPVQRGQVDAGTRREQGARGGEEVAHVPPVLLEGGDHRHVGRAERLRHIRPQRGVGADLDDRGAATGGHRTQGVVEPDRPTGLLAPVLGPLLTGQCLACGAGEHRDGRGDGGQRGGGLAQLGQDRVHQR